MLFFAVSLLLNIYLINYNIQPSQICCPSRNEILFVEYHSVQSPDFLMGDRILKYLLNDGRIEAVFNKNVSEYISIRLSWNGRYFSTYNNSEDVLKVFSDRKKVFEEREFKGKILKTPYLRNHLSKSLDLPNHKITLKEMCEIFYVETILVTEDRIILFCHFDGGDCPSPYCILDIDYRKNETMKIIKLGLDTGLAAPVIPNIEYEKPEGFFIHSDGHRLSFYDIENRTIIYFDMGSQLNCLDYRMVGDQIFFAAHRTGKDEEPSLYMYDKTSKQTKILLNNCEYFQVSGKFLLLSREIKHQGVMESREELYSLEDEGISFVNLKKSYRSEDVQCYLLPFDRLFLKKRNEKFVNIIDLDFKTY